MPKKFKMEGYIDYPGVGRITDEDVYNLIMRHSRWIDRINHRKMVEMSLLGQCVLMQIFENVRPEDPSWKFYGKHAVKP